MPVAARIGSWVKAMVRPSGESLALQSSLVALAQPAAVCETTPSGRNTAVSTVPAALSPLVREGPDGIADQRSVRCGRRAHQ